jgi:Zn-dependent protease with chaperone function
MNSLYPPGPANVSKEFTQPTARYRWEVALVLVSLLLSLVLYLILVAGSAWLCYFLVTAPWPMRADGWYVFWRIVFIISAGMLSLYLVKGLFKGSHQDQSLLLEITEADQPDLFAFIRQICAETGAPFPHKVYLTPDVNAAVFYQSSFLSLFLPTPKNLLIGLGLVNVLNLSEFKAVLAHEFGHFSQKSMKLGSYVYVANKVMADIIYGRDFMDDILNVAKSLDIRIAVVVWIFMGILWLFRKVLELVFKAINIFSLSLSRQMEFNADRIGVSVAGSDAMVHALLRSGFGDQAFRQLGSDLWSAADQRLYSKDIFQHQIPAGEHLRRRAKQPQLGARPIQVGPDVEVFKAGDGELAIPAMWSTHPSNHDREKNAKEHYLPAEIDEQSPWLLFRDVETVRFLVSQRYYEVAHRPDGKIEYANAQIVQKFLDDEYAETTYADHYHGYYDNRYLEIPKLEPLFADWAAEPLTPEEIAEELQAMFGPEMQTWIKEHSQRLDEHDLLAGVKAGTLQLKTNTVDFRGQAHPPAAVSSLLEQVQAELKDDQAYAADIDAFVLRIHRQLAYALDEPLAKELVARYRFHLGVQELHRSVLQAIQEAHGALGYAGGAELSPEGFAYVRDTLRTAARRIFDTLDESGRYRIPALKNMSEGDSLRDFLLQKAVVSQLGATQDSIDPIWIQRFLAQAAEIQDKLRRLHFKSMGALLQLQEQIRRRHQSSAQASQPKSIPDTGF